MTSGSNENHDDDPEWLIEQEARGIPMGMTPLMWAASNGDVAEVKQCIEAGADVNERWTYEGQGEFAYYLALSNGHQEVAKILEPLTDAELVAGAKQAQPSQRNDQISAMIQAIHCEDLKEVQRLVDDGVELNWLAEHGQAALTVNGRNSIAFIKELIRMGADVDAGTTVRYLDGSGNTRAVLASTALETAASHGDAERIRLLLDAGADVNLPVNMHRQFPLMSAVAGGYGEVVRILVDAGADTTLLDQQGRSVLDYAEAASRNPEFERVLIDVGIQPSDHMRLINAVIQGDVPTVRGLLETGMNANLKNDDGYSLLNLAILNDHADILALLIAFEADINQPIALRFGTWSSDDRKWAGAIRSCPKCEGRFVGQRCISDCPACGTTSNAAELAEVQPELQRFGEKYPAHYTTACAPVRLAARLGQVDIVEMLLKVGAEVTGPRVRGCIVHALWYGHDDLANLLIRAGADIDYEDPGLKMTALEVANNSGFEETVMIINDRLADQ